MAKRSDATVIWHVRVAPTTEEVYRELADETGLSFDALLDLGAKLIRRMPELKAVQASWSEFRQAHELLGVGPVPAEPAASTRRQNS